MKTDTDTTKLLGMALHSAACEYVNGTGTVARQAFGQMLGIQAAVGCYDDRLGMLISTMIDAIIDAKYAAHNAARKVAA